jgi:hypothetical protein
VDEWNSLFFFCEKELREAKSKISKLSVERMNERTFNTFKALIHSMQVWFERERESSVYLKYTLVHNAWLSGFVRHNGKEFRIESYLKIKV